MSETAPSAPAEHLVCIEDSEALAEVLQSHGFDINHWGDGPTKTVEALWSEVVQGETEIIEVDSELIRRTSVAAVDVWACLRNGEQYKLREDKQVYNNGSERHRDLITSLGEKIKPGETTDEAVRRAINEELGVLQPQAVCVRGTQLLTKLSQTFDGMRTQLKLHMADVEIAEEDFRAEGYIERQVEKSVYFVWDKIN